MAKIVQVTMYILRRGGERNDALRRCIGSEVKVSGVHEIGVNGFKYRVHVHTIGRDKMTSKCRVLTPASILERAPRRIHLRDTSAMKDNNLPACT